MDVKNIVYKTNVKFNIGICQDYHITYSNIYRAEKILKHYLKQNRLLHIGMEIEKVRDRYSDDNVPKVYNNNGELLLENNYLKNDKLVKGNNYLMSWKY